MTFPLENEPTVGNSDKLEEQEHAYKAAEEEPRPQQDRDEADHALGGSEGTTDGM